MKFGKLGVALILLACGLLAGVSCGSLESAAAATKPPTCIPPDCPPPPPCNKPDGQDWLTGYTLGQATVFNTTTFDSTDWYNWGGSAPGEDTVDSATQPYGWYNSNELDPTKNALYLLNDYSTQHTYTADLVGGGTESVDSIDTEGIGSKTYSQSYGAYDWCQQVTNNDEGISGITPIPTNTLDTVALLWPVPQYIESVTVSGGTATATMASADGFSDLMSINITSGPYYSATPIQITTTSSTTFTFSTSVSSNCSSACGEVQLWPPEIDLSESTGKNSDYSMTIHFYDENGDIQSVQAVPSSFLNSENWNEFQARWTSSSVSLFEGGSQVAQILDGTGTDLPSGCNPAEAQCYKVYCATVASADSDCVPAEPMGFDFEQGAFYGTSFDDAQTTAIGWIDQFSPG